MTQSDIDTLYEPWWRTMTLNESLAAFGFTHRRITGWQRVGTHEIFDADGEHIGFFRADECWKWIAASLSGTA
jgi:hypothetical protein